MNAIRKSRSRYSTRNVAHGESEANENCWKNNGVDGKNRSDTFSVAFRYFHANYQPIRARSYAPLISTNLHWKFCADCSTRISVSPTAESWTYCYIVRIPTCNLLYILYGIPADCAIEIMTLLKWNYDAI